MKSLSVNVNIFTLLKYYTKNGNLTSYMLPLKLEFSLNVFNIIIFIADSMVEIRS